jgi:magnesium transporter
MFTLSVVLGSSILYKDFNSATPERLLKFIFGCLSTFIGVYLITSKRHVQRPPKHRRSQASLHHQQQPSSQSETAPLMVVGSVTSSSSSDNLGETPPHLIGTSFGYHFTNPRILERRTSRSTLPRHAKQRNDMASAIWSTWRQSEGEHGESLEPEGMGRTQSDRPATATNGVEAWRTNEDTLSEIVQDERGSWGRSRGYSAV